MLLKTVWIKFISMFLVVAFVSACFPFGTLNAAAEDSSSQSVESSQVSSIAVLSPPQKTQYYFELDGFMADYWKYDLHFFYDDLSHLSGLQVQVNYTDGTQGVYSYDDTSSQEFNGDYFNFDDGQYDEPWDLGTHEVMVYYKGISTSYDVEVVEDNRQADSIEVLSPPQKSQFTFEKDGWWSTHYDSDSGLEVPYFEYDVNNNVYGFRMQVNYTDGTSEVYFFDGTGKLEFNNECISIESGQSDNPWDVGKHEVSVYYMGKSTTYEAEVVEDQNPVASIEVLSAPDKTKYISEYDGSIEDFWKYDPCFYYNDLQNLNGFQMKVNYKDGTSAVYSYDDDYSLWFYGEYLYIDDGQFKNPWGIGKHMVTVYYMDRTASYEVEVVANPVASIEVLSPPQKTQCVFEQSGYWDGDHFIYYPSYEGFQMKVNYTDGTSAIYSYDDDGSVFMDESVEIEANQNDETWEIGKHNVTVSYRGRTTSFEVEVVAQNSVDSIELVSPPDKTTYLENADGYWSWGWIDGQYTPYFYYSVECDYKGMQVKINYADGTSKLYSYNDFYSTYGYEDYFHISTEQDYEQHWELGEHTVTVSYFGKEDTFTVEVIENTVQSIEVVSLPTDHDYIVGEVKNIDGMKLKINYKDNTFKTVTIDSKDNLSKDYASGLWVDGHLLRFIFEDQVGEYINAKSGTNKLSIVYMGASTSINLTATENKMDHFVIKKQPSRFNGTGMVITVYETDGTSYDLTIGEVVSYAGGGDEGYFAEASFARTEKGTFELSSEIYYDSFFHITKYTYTFNGMEVKGTELPDTGAGELAARTISVGSLAMKDKVGFDFDGTITADNIDAVVLSLYPLFYWGTEISADDLTGMINKVYECQSVDLTLSENYDPQTKIYTIPGRPNGECPYDNAAVTVDNDGNYIVSYFWNWEDSAHLKTSTMVVSPTWKILSVSYNAAVIPGDINNDGGVDLMDVTLLSRYVAGWQGLTVGEQTLDVNRDGDVDLMDVTLLSRYVAGWNVTI